MEGCIRIRVGELYSHPEKYAVSRVVETLGIDITIIDKLNDEHTVLSRPFREQGILALDMKFTNNGNDNITLATPDFVLELESGERVSAVNPKGKVSLVGSASYDLTGCEFCTFS